LTIIVNFFAGSGVGKSVLATDLYSKLKKLNIETELALEFAKDLVWEENYSALKNQIYVFGNQLHRIERLINKVDVIITDSHLLLSIIYKPNHLSNKFDKLVLEVFNSYDNLNYFIKRTHPFNPSGRVEKTIEEAIIKDNQIKEVLINNNIPYESVTSEEKHINNIIDDIVKSIEWRKRWDR
jgi:hypothetical protein